MAGQKAWELYAEMKASGEQEVSAALENVSKKTEELAEKEKELKAATDEANKSLEQQAEATDKVEKSSGKLNTGMVNLAASGVAIQKTWEMGITLGNAIGESFFGAEIAAKRFTETLEEMNSVIQQQQAAAFKSMQDGLKAAGIDTDAAKKKFEDFGKAQAEVLRMQDEKQKDWWWSGSEQKDLDEMTKKVAALSREIKGLHERSKEGESKAASEASAKEAEKEAEKQEEIKQKLFEETEKKQKRLKEQNQKDLATDEEKIHLEAERKRQEIRETMQSAQSEAQREEGRRLLREVDAIENKNLDEYYKRKAEKEAKVLEAALAKELDARIKMEQQIAKARADAERGYGMGDINFGTDALVEELQRQGRIASMKG